jgi:hypothetical protein
MTATGFSKFIQFEIPQSLPMQSERTPGNAKGWEASAMNARKDGGLVHGMEQTDTRIFMNYEKGMKSGPVVTPAICN